MAIKLQVEQNNDETRNSEMQEAKLLELLIPVMGISNLPTMSRIDRCAGKGLLPPPLASCLNVLQFLTYSVLSAQKAQRLFGVRASVLLAMALDESGFDVSYLIDDPAPFKENAGVCSLSPSIDRWFLKRARKLSTDKHLRKAMSCANDPKAYIFELFGLGFCDRIDAADLVNNIENYSLEFCDRAGMLAVGQYRALAFEDVCNFKGDVLGLRPTPYSELFSEDGNLDGREGIAAAS